MSDHTDQLIARTDTTIQPQSEETLIDRLVIAAHDGSSSLTRSQLRCDICRQDQQKCIFTGVNTACDRCRRNQYICTIAEQGPPNKRRKHSSHKCKSCRESKQKCLPEDRIWPAKCLRCTQKGLPCSEPRTTAHRDIDCHIDSPSNPPVSKIIDTVQKIHQYYRSDITNEFEPLHIDNHHIAERSGVQPIPSTVIPFSRDSDFVGREKTLNELYEKWTTPGSRIALVGLGGVGKSQLAIECAYRIREQSPERWVFWVHASNIARFELSFRNIANYVQVPGRQDKDADIFQLVHDWLRDERRKWLLILDNVDDADFLLVHGSQAGQTTIMTNKNEQPLASYLPQCQNGSILFTTRSRGVAWKLVEDRDIIVIEPMYKAEAVTLLQKKLKGDYNDKNLGELAAALEYIPLAIIQAAAYISQRAPFYSVRKYLDGFRESDRKKENLLSREAGHLRRDRGASNSIITTWQTSFGHIRQVRKSAADLLSVMSFFDRQGIPDVLIRNRYGNQFPQSECSMSNNENGVEGDHDNSNGDNIDSDVEVSVSVSSVNSEGGFEDDIMTLQEYSFVLVNNDGRTFEMHHLVQLATRRWLIENNEYQRWEGQFLRSLDRELPNGEYQNWPTCQLLFPHVMEAAGRKPKDPAHLHLWASILYKGAWYTWKLGDGLQTETLSLGSMKARKNVLGEEDDKTLQSMEMAGHAQNLQGRWDMAEELFMRVIEIRKKKLGEYHPDTLTSITNLASTFWNQGRWDAAEELEVQVMEIRKKTLGEDHPDTLTSIANLASTLWNQGRWDAAEELEVRVMETSKKLLGKDHPDTLTSMVNLASTYRNQGRLDAAEELEVRVMETRKKKLGADHPDTLTCMANLASTYRNQGRWDAAEALEVQVMETRKKKLGEDHPDTLTIIANLASTYRNQGRWDAAEELEVQVMETRKKKFGPDHPSTLTSIANLAATFWYQGRWDAAEELEVQVMEIRKKKLGEDHPDTLTSMANLAATYKNQGRWEAAEELEVQLMETSKKLLGEHHRHIDQHG